MKLDAGVDECVRGFVNPACPWLPEVSAVLDFSATRDLSEVKGLEYYEAALRYSHSQWLVGKPAQALLQMNKAWMADLGEVGEVSRPPYRALVWMMGMSAAGSCGFLGNPVRHFQHLASRMSGVRAEVRSWRAWVCFHLSEKVLGGGRFPRDGEQLAREGLWIPSMSHALVHLGKSGWPGEVEEAAAAWGGGSARKDAWRMGMDG